MLKHWRQLEKETGGTISQQEVIDLIADEFGWEIKRGALRNLRTNEQKIMQISCAFEEKQKKIMTDRLANLNNRFIF